MLKRCGIVEDDGPLSRKRRLADPYSLKSRQSFADQEEDQHDSAVRLGTTQQPYKKTNVSTTFHQFLASRRADADAWKIAL